MASANTGWKGWVNPLLGFSLTLLFLFMMAPFVVTMLLAAVVAILTNPVHQALKKWKVPSGLSAFLVTTGVTLLVLLPFGLLLFSGAHRLLNLLSDVQAEFPASDWLHHPVLKHFIDALSRYASVDEDWIREQGLHILQSIGGTISRALASTLAAMPSLMLGFFVVVLSVFFFLKDGEALLRFITRLSPVPVGRGQQLFRTFETSCRGVVLSLLGSAVIQGILMTIFAAITDLPNPFFLGMLTLIFGMVPIIGAAPVWMGAVIYLAIKSSLLMTIVMAAGGLLISFSDNVVRPIILKEHSQIHPLLALVSAFGAIQLVGATGIFLGPVIAAVFVSFLNILSVENQNRGQS